MLEKTEGQSRNHNPEKLSTLGTENTGRRQPNQMHRHNTENQTDGQQGPKQKQEVNPSSNENNYSTASCH